MLAPVSRTWLLVDFEHPGMSVFALLGMLELEMDSDILTESVLV